MVGSQGLNGSVPDFLTEEYGAAILQRFAAVSKCCLKVLILGVLTSQAA